MNRYSELRKYIDNNISKLNEQLEELISLREQLDDAQSLFLILTNDFVGIKNENINLLNKLLNDDFSSTIKSILICFPYFSDSILANEPQVVSARYLLSDIIRNVEEKINSLQVKIDNFNNDDFIMIEINRYLKYLSLFDDNGVVKAIDLDEMDGFINFVRNANLDISKEELLELITEFCTFNLNYYAEKLESSVMINQSIVAQNSREVFDEIDEIIREADPISELGVIPDKIEVDLTEEEVEKLNAITKLAEDLKDIYNSANADIGVFVDNNDFTLKLRVDLYDSALTKDEMWNMVLQDLTKFLIPSLAKDKESIMKIFDYILDLYNKEFVDTNINEGVISYKFSEEDTMIIKDAKELLEKFSKEIDIFNNYSDADINIIDSIYQLILENNVENLEKNSSKFSLTYIKFIKKLMKLRENVISLADILDKEEEHRLECGNKEVDEIIKIILDDIYTDVSDVILLDEQRKKIEDDKIEENVEDVNLLDGAKNLLIFLPKNGSRSGYYFEDDKSEILRKEKSVLTDVSNGLDILMSYNVTNKSEKSDSFRRISSKSHPRFIRRDIKPFRYRRGNSRIAFSMLPLSSNNKQVLMKMLGLNNDNINVILVMNFGIEYDSQEIYDSVLNRIIRGREDIKQIQDVFGNDFNNETMVVASELVQHGFRAIEDIHRSCRLDGRSNNGK